MTITFPGKSPASEAVSYEGVHRFVLIGANGSGKTRLGIWLEHQNEGAPTHRISAQKALSIPEYAPLMSSEQAEKNLLYGRLDQHATIGNRNNSRWGGEPATFLLSDYEKVLSLLFARSAERDSEHAKQTRLTESYIPVRDSPIDSIVKVWGDLMPHRSVSLEDGKVTANRGTPSEYHGKNMSDGERVALYLLGQCLCAPANSIIIIDEPELHLHRSLMDKLWNKIEEICPNKTFVYITHDLDFAASRAGAIKLWIQKYADGGWSWAEVPYDEAIPEALILELIGNRKPILFCEGDRGGLDHTVYQICYPHLHVAPRGGSEKVVEATKALKENSALHTLSARGIVDRDVRTQEECDALISKGVEVLELAEVENLFCLEAVVRQVASKLLLDPDATVVTVREFIGAAMSVELELHIVMRAERRIRYHLATYSTASSNEIGLVTGVEQLLAGLDVASFVAEARTTLSSALESEDLNQMLRLYNRKSIAARISTCFGLKHGEYPDLVIRALKGADGASFVEAIRTYLPAFDHPAPSLHDADDFTTAGRM